MAFSLTVGKNKRFLATRLSAPVVASLCEARDQPFVRQSRRPQGDGYRAVTGKFCGTMVAFSY
jgi:hypothetical protein